MDIAASSEKYEYLKRVDRLRNNIVQRIEDVEYGSLLSLPSFSSQSQWTKEIPNKVRTEISNTILVGELILFECQNLFEELQSMEKAYQDFDRASESLVNAEKYLQNVELLNTFKSLPTSVPPTELMNQYRSKVDFLENFARRENIDDNEKKYLEGLLEIKSPSIFSSFLSSIKAKVWSGLPGEKMILDLGKTVEKDYGGIIKMSRFLSRLPSSAL